VRRRQCRRCREGRQRCRRGGGSTAVAEGQDAFTVHQQPVLGSLQAAICARSNRALRRQAAVRKARAPRAARGGRRRTRCTGAPSRAECCVICAGGSGRQVFRRAAYRRKAEAQARSKVNSRGAGGQEGQRVQGRRQACTGRGAGKVQKATQKAGRKGEAWQAQPAQGAKAQAEGRRRKGGRCARRAGEAARRYGA